MGAENLAVHGRRTADEHRHDLSHHDQYLHDDIVVFQPGAEPDPCFPTTIIADVGSRTAWRIAMLYLRVRRILVKTADGVFSSFVADPRTRRLYTKSTEATTHLPASAVQKCSTPAPTARHRRSLATITHPSATLWAQPSRNPTAT